MNYRIAKKIVCAAPHDGDHIPQYTRRQVRAAVRVSDRRMRREQRRVRKARGWRNQ